MPRSLPKGKESSILIVGGGTLGLSTALHLSNRGYTNITVLDRGETIPSAYSAGNDVNKIVRADYEEEFYATHALKAIHTWRTSPLFSPYYHQTGYLVASTSSAPAKSTSHIDRLIKSITTHPQQPKSCLTRLATSAEVRKKLPQLTGALDGWSGYFNTHAGYASAGPALKALFTELVARGVVFTFGIEGSAEAILPDAETTKIFPSAKPYVRTMDKKVHCADVIILALGAHAARLLPSAGAQLTAKAWAVGHVRISATEAARLKGLPVVNCRDLGFFFEPVLVREKGKKEQWWIKLCAQGAGYTNKAGGSTSLAPVEASENDGIPLEDEILLRRLLQAALPEFASRPLIRRFVCWCADTADSEYVIDYVPGYEGLILAGGDSGHAFKMLPIFGEWVVDVVEHGSQEIKRWGWKYGESDGKEDIDWRVGSVKDISEVERREDGCDEAVKSKL